MSLCCLVWDGEVVVAVEIVKGGTGVLSYTVTEYMESCPTLQGSL